MDRAWRQQRQFVADASHELKTPLTVITTNAELLQLPDCNEADKARCSSSILAMSRQMRSLVERLLELARADCEQSQMTFARLDYSALIELALLPFEPVFFEKGLLLSGQIQPNIQVNGSAPHLQQVIDILLDNAQKYSVSPGTVEVKLQQNGRHHCLLSVSNPGGPISKEDLKQIFKRFYRLDPARTGDGSFGLGLSIAESIIAEHRGRIWAESGDGRVTFLIELPTRG